MHSRRSHRLKHTCRRIGLGLFSTLLTAAVAVAGDPLPSYTPPDALVSGAYTGDLPELLEKGTVRVLITMNRTNFFLADGNLHGFEYALLNEYEKGLVGQKRGESLKPMLVFIPVSRDRLLPDLVAGRGDIAAAGLTITRKRMATVDFTAPYLTGVDELLVTHANSKTPRDITAISGKKVFVRKSSSYYESLVSLNRTFSMKGIAPVDIVAVDENLETEDILELVNSGAMERTVCDSHIARAWAGVMDGIRVHDTIRLRQGGKIAWAVRKESPVLKESLDRFIREHREGTLLGNIFFQRYYKDNVWIENPMKGDAGKRIHQYSGLFKKYAERYGFDWRLISAMAFRESGLDHQKKSPRGAVGLMQVRPATAADPKVNIKDVEDVENNVHAAVKYLNFIRDHYFDSAEIPPRDRIRFALAAYNAGPTRIRKARKRAERMRLDPNKWFRNVELATLMTVGREPVQYVSSINKYYVIYKNALEQPEVDRR